MNQSKSFRLNRRSFLKLAGTAVGSSVMAPLLTSCGPTETPLPPTPTTGVSLPADAVAPLAASGTLPETELVVAYYEGPEADRHVSLAPDFTTYTQGRIDVRVEALARETLDSRFATAMQAGQYIWDVAPTFNLNIKQIADAGWIEPLDDYLADPELLNAALYDLADFPESVRDMLTYNGKLYMLPMQGTAAMFFYRKDLFDRWGLATPPAEGYSWADLREVALQVRDNLADEGMDGAFPLAFGGQVPASALNSLQAIWSYGHEVFGPDFRPHFGEAPAVEAIQFLVDMVFSDQVVSPGVAGYEFMEVLAALQQGAAVMGLQFDAAASMLADPTMSPDVAGKIGYASWPYAESAGPDQARIIPVLNSVGIPTSAAHKREAFEYMAWFTSKEVSRQAILDLGSNIPRTSILNDPEIQAKYEHFPTLLRGFSLYHDLPRLAENMAIIFGIVGPHMNSIFAGETPVADGLNAIDAEITQMLTSSGVLS